MVLSHAPVTIPSRKMRTNVRNMNVFIEQLLALFTNPPEHGAGNFKVMTTDGALPTSTSSK
jgi:hypothetical protein